MYVQYKKQLIWTRRATTSRSMVLSLSSS